MNLDGLNTADFNHLYVTLQEQTVKAIGESSFVADRFLVNTIIVEADDESWTATYLLGLSAYLEIFAPGGSEGFREGFSGTAFSTQVLGQIDRFEDRLSRISPQWTKRDLRVRRINGGEVPWFHYLMIDSPESNAFSAWLMDVHEEYIAWRGIELPTDDLFDRAAYLRASGVTEHIRVEDIQEVQLELTAEEQSQMEMFMGALGYSTVELANMREFSSRNFILRTSVVSDPVYRIRKVACTLRQPELESTKLRFGPDAILRAEGEKLIWGFGLEA